MPRKPSRRKPASPPRVPGKSRPRAKPGRRSRAAAVRATARKVHGARGSRTGPRRKKTAAPRTRKPRFVAPTPERVTAICDGLHALYPDAHCELDFQTPLQLLIATILSAQCTDARVNKVTPGLFAKYPDAAAFAAAPQEELEEAIRSTG